MTPDFSHAFTLAAEPDGARRVFAYARQGLLQSVDALLVTASVYDVPNMRSRRVWTDDATAYPTGNFKLLERNEYFETVIEGRQPFSSTTIEGMAKVFFDHEKIKALGFESNLNLPAIAEGEVIGTINLLHRKGHYTAERVAEAMAWQPIATLAFLLLDREGSDTASFHDSATTVANGVVEG